MITVSAAAKAALEGTSRTFLARLLRNGEVISGDIRSVVVHKGSCGDQQFAVGALFCPYIDVVIDGCGEALKGVELTLQIGIVMDSGTEWYGIGSFTALEPERSTRRITFTAVGRISARMGGTYVSSLTYPASIASVLEEIESATGVSIRADLFDTSAKIERNPSGYSYREVLAYIAGLFFGFVTEDSSGNIVFGSYGTTDVFPTDGDRTNREPAAADEDLEVTGLSVITETDAEEASYESGDPVVMTVSNPFMTGDIFESNAGNVIGYSYRPATVSLSLGDFRLEPTDTLRVTNDEGAVYHVPCMYVQHTFDGGITTEVVAPRITSLAREEAFRGATSLTLANIVKAVQKAQSTADAGIQNVEVWFIQTDSESIAPAPDGPGWSTDAPAWEEGMYVWQKIVTVYADGRTSTAGPTCISGADGQGVSIESSLVEYQEGTSPTDSPTGPWSADVVEVAPGNYLWTRITNTYTDGTVNVSYGVARQGQDGETGEDGEDAVVLKIDSSRGTAFKNNMVSTVLTVTIYYGAEIISTSEKLAEVFGTGAFLQWEWQNMDDNTYGTILATDSRLSDKGFRFTISPEDVDTKVTLRCSLNT